MFDELAALARDPDGVLARVAQEFVATGDLHRLFSLRLAQHRFALDLGVDGSQGIDDLAEPLRSKLEAGYVEACREVGALLLEAGRFREAWTYLRPAGDRHLVREHLARVVLDESRADELIEIAFYEAVDPERGIAWLLGRQGVCNAITALDSLQGQLSAADLQACAAVLVRHVYRELRGNLRGHLQRIEGSAPDDLSIVQLIDRHPELLADGSYHLDPSHLASTVRFARVLNEPPLLRMAIEMAEYGSRLPDDLQYPGEAPFEELYATHGMFFRALLGESVDEAVDYFRRRAEESDPQESTTALEAYLVLLSRTGRLSEAMQAFARFAPRDRPLSRHAPTLLELAQRGGEWPLYESVCREREDLLGFAVGLLAAAASEQAATEIAG